MTIFYSKITNSFYDDQINKQIPNDAKEITKEKHNELLNLQSLGQLINSDVDGNPVNIINIIPLQQVKENKKTEITKQRDIALNLGFFYKGNRFDCTEVSRTNVLGIFSAIKASIPLPDNFVWRSYENVNISFTEQDFVEMATEMLNYVNMIYVYSFELKDLIDSLDNVDAVTAINWDI